MALGHLDRHGDVQTFTPVATQAANRLLLASVAKDQDHLLAFDETNAFLGAEIDRDVYCRLPEIWAKKHGCSIAKRKRCLYGLTETWARKHGYSIVKLKRCLYGLTDRPIGWYLKYSSGLKNLG